MELQTKLAILADAAKYDASCASSGVKRSAQKGGVGHADGMGICHSFAPDGRCISLLKILLTNYCVYDCRYCINRVSSNVRRAKFSVEEVVTLTLDFYRRNYIEGLFLSSGVNIDADRTMDEMVEIARRLRQVHKFGGYIHLKAVAGCSNGMLTKAGLYADRLSANIELPTQADLDSLAPAKTHAEVESAMVTMSQHIEAAKDARKHSRLAPTFAPGGQSTQMIIGATPSSDQLALRQADHLYRSHGLRRVYYSAYSPIADAADQLPHVAPPLLREHRLYQADWLLRFYGFSIDELTYTESQNLSLKHDPKLAWALAHRNLFPVDVNTASLEMLMRVPGIGVGGAQRIVQTRRQKRLRLHDLSMMRIGMKQARFFINTADRNVAVQRLDSQNLHRMVQKPQQLELTLSGQSARTGQL